MKDTVLVYAARVFEPSDKTASAWLARLPAPRSAALRAMPAASRWPSLLASHLLWRQSMVRGHGPDALRSLTYAPHGRPSLQLAMHFSISHGAGWAVVASSDAFAVGVDVEAIGEEHTPGPRAGEFSRYLDPGERSWAGDDARRFVSLWTCKEAVVKAAAEGGLRDLARVRCRDGGNAAVFEGREWSCPEITVAPGCMARLAHPAEAGSPAITVRRLERRQLESEARSPAREP